jgi:hypothetical protein
MFLNNNDQWVKAKNLTQSTESADLMAYLSYLNCKLNISNDFCFNNFSFID